MQRENSDSDNAFNTNFTIMAFTNEKRKVGDTIKYKVLDYDAREIEATLEELDFVAKKDNDTMAMFLNFLGGKANYEKLLG